MNKILHIIPAAGKASRIGGIPKFLLPIGEENFLIKFHVQNLLANIPNVKKVIAVSSENYESVKRMDLNAEIIRVDTQTMNETVSLVVEQYQEYENYVLTMPDTYYEDNLFMENLYKIHIQNKHLITLGVWSAMEYQIGRLGQVMLNEDEVVDVVDKDMNCKYKHVWGVIAWNKSVNKYIDNEDPHIGYILKPALNDNINIQFTKATGTYFDCGTFSEYKRLIDNINS